MKGMLNQIAEQQLRKAGWYPKRNVDISDQIEFWESCGYQTFDAAVQFMKEYGKLHIIDKFISSFDNNLNEDRHTTFVTEILDFYNECDEREKFEFNLCGMAKEKILPVVRMEDEVEYFIGESGVIYSDDGLCAETPEIFWNEYYGGYVGTDCGWVLPWDKIGTGEQRKRLIGNGKGCRRYI